MGLIEPGEGAKLGAQVPLDALHWHGSETGLALAPS